MGQTRNETSAYTIPKTRTREAASIIPDRRYTVDVEGTRCVKALTGAATFPDNFSQGRSKRKRKGISACRDGRVFPLVV